MSSVAARRPESEHLLEAVRRRIDLLIAFDPGLNQLLMALGVVIGVSASLGIVYLFIQATHVLWIEAPAGAMLKPTMIAALDAQHHGATLLAMLLSGIVGMVTASSVVDTDPRELTITMVLMPIPMLAAMALAIQFLDDRTLAILVLALVMAAAVYAPKFSPRIGPRASVLGMMLFIGYLFGLLSRGAITNGDIGWVSIILWVAAAVNFALKLAVFVPLTGGTLRRTIRAFFARSRGVIVCSAQVFAAEDGRELARASRRLHNRLARLNEAALIADGLLNEHGEIADEMHVRLFRTELSVQNIGRIAEALGDVQLPGEVRDAIRECLLEARDTRREPELRGLPVLRAFGEDRATMRADPLTASRVLRLADSLSVWRVVTRQWREQALEPVTEPAPFETPVTLMFGNLPGSALVSRTAAAPPGSLRARLGLDFPAQSSIRLGAAVVVAAAIGSVLSEQRFYWAVLAVFVSFIGTNTSGEQLTKAAERVGGTVAGILIGMLLANAIGHSTWSIAVVLVALFFGIYFIRASYALMVLGLTITVAQVYVQLGESIDHLLVLRLEETAIGAGVAALAALVIFPIHSRRAARVAVLEYYARLGDLLDGLMRRLSGERADLTIASRSLDSAGHALRSTILPLSRLPRGGDDVQHNLLLFAQGAHRARNIAAEVDSQLELDGQARGAVVKTLRTQRRLVGALEHRVGQREVVNGHGFARASDPDGHDDCTLTEELRRDGDLLAVSLNGDGGERERHLVRYIAQLDETLAELGDNMIKCGDGGDDRTRQPEPELLAGASGGGRQRLGGGTTVEVKEPSLDERRPTADGHGNSRKPIG